MKHVSLFILLLSHAAIAQNNDSTAVATIPEISNFRRGMILEFGLAPTITLSPTIRSFFKANQIKPDGVLSLFFNFGFGIRLKRTKIFGQNGFGLKDGHSYYELPATGPETVAQNTIANYTSVWVGYDVLNARNRRLYINAGFGGMEYGFNVFRRTNQVVPFSTILQTNQIGNASSLLLRGVGYVDVNLEYTQREKRRQSIGFTTRIGYRFGTYAKAYESDAYKLIDAPTDRLSQIYVQTLVNLSFNGDRWHKWLLR